MYAAEFGYESDLYEDYREALDLVESGPARKRLELFGDNMVVLCKVLDAYGILKNARQSRFHRSNEVFTRFVKAKAGSIAMHFSFSSNSKDGPYLEAYRRTFVTTAYSEKIAVAEPVRPYRVRGDQHVVFVPDRNEVVFHFSDVKVQTSTLNYAVYDDAGKLLRKGMVAAEGRLGFPVKAGRAHHLIIRGHAGIFRLKLPDVHYAFDSRFQQHPGRGSSLHLMMQMTPLYFHVPKGVRGFSVTLASAAPGETAVIEVYNAANRKVATLNTAKISPHAVKLECQPGDEGFWKLVIKEAEKGVLDDVYIYVSKKLSGFFSIEPDKLLTMKRKQ